MNHILKGKSFGESGVFEIETNGKINFDGLHCFLEPGIQLGEKVR